MTTPATNRFTPPKSAYASESLRLGSVNCDFMRPETFRALCQRWLTSPEEAKLHHVVTLNPEMVLAAEHDTAFRTAIERAEVRVPDGAGLIWAQWYIRSQFWSLVPSLLAFSFRQVERIPGVDTVWQLARLCAKHNTPLYLLGGTQPQVERTANLLRQELPQLLVHTSIPHKFDLAGPATIVQDIQTKKPGVLLVAYGATKQTTWIEKHRSQLPSVRIAVGVGGAFAILSEDKPRAPHFLRQLNMEWLWRLLLEPSRLPRIWRATVAFPLLISRQKAAHPPVFTANTPSV